MVTVDRFDYVFVRRPGKANEFDRRQIFTAKENHDVVIVAEASPDHPGLTPGQEVVTTGSLILEQLYEDKEMTEGGFLVSRDGEKNVASIGSNQPLDCDFTSRTSLNSPNASARRNGNRSGSRRPTVQLCTVIAPDNVCSFSSGEESVVLPAHSEQSAHSSRPN